VTEDLLERIDVFGYLGHFMLYRNTEDIRTLFMKSGALYDYRRVFSKKEHYAFDEYTGLKCIVEDNHIPHFYEDSIVADISDVYRQMRVSRIKNFPYQVFYWENGRVFRSHVGKETVYNEEYLYLHFQKKNPIPEEGILTSDAFYIFFDRFEEKRCGIPGTAEIKEKADWGGVKREKKERFYRRARKIFHFMKISIPQKIIWIRQRRFNSKRKRQHEK
jgi:hypothetical protein